MKKGLVALWVFSALLCIFSAPVTAQFAGIDMPGGKRSRIFDMVSNYKCREMRSGKNKRSSISFRYRKKELHASE